MDKQKAIDGLKIALQTELNGVEFYRLAAERTADPKGKSTFKTLADDEIKHFNALQKHYASLVKTAKWAPAISLGEASNFFKGESPIFSDQIKARIKERHFEISALSIGALLETNSIDFYRRMKEESDDPVARDFFDRLQKWEEGHLEAITKQLEILKEDYWAEQHFAPLF